jgi:protein-tyrosine-phosphatase/N-acetylglutamate synthase-like GNAT family acetyltransferase
MNNSIKPAEGDYYQELLRLLEKHKLPITDIEGKELFVLLDESNKVVGTGGLEYFNGHALLRSIAVDDSHKGKGLGKFITGELEKIARKKGSKDIYLLTTTADGFFQSQGYQVVERNNVPEEVRKSSEFTTVCPDTAIAMRKPLVKKILFVCVENSNRSQMSEAMARIIGKDAIEPYSAGSRPSGKVNPKAINAMKELGYDLSTHQSKSLEEVKEYAPFDIVVTMGCGDACPWMPAKKFVDWDIPDPRDLDEEGVRKIRDLIKQKVSELVPAHGT